MSLKKQMKRGKNQSLYKYLPDEWIDFSVRGKERRQYIAKVIRWNSEKLDNINEKRLIRTVNESVRSFENQGSGYSHISPTIGFGAELTKDNCDVLTPKASNEERGIIAQISPLIFYCKICNKVYQFNREDEYQSHRYCTNPGCNHAELAQFRQIYFCKCGYATDKHNPRCKEHGYQYIKWYGNYNFICTKCKRQIPMQVTCPVCGNMLRPKVALDPAQFLVFSLSLIDLINEELENFIVSSDDTPEEIATKENMKQDINNLLISCNLKPRERDILILRYGLDGKEPMTLVEIGKIYNLTRERVRQIESNALKKIRKSNFVKRLVDYTESPTKSLLNIEMYRQIYKEDGNSNRAFLRRFGDKIEDYEVVGKLPSIYQLFGGYSKEQIDLMLTKLTEEERKLITLRYGDDLEKPKATKLSKEESRKYYGVLVPKMKRLLSNPDKVRKTRRENLKHEKNKIEDSNISVSEKNSTDISVEQSKRDIPASFDKKIDIDNIQDHDSLLAYMKKSLLDDMMKNLTTKELIIMQLFLGYIDGKYFTIDYISEFLKIDRIEVLNTIKKALFLNEQKFLSLIKFEAIEFSNAMRNDLSFSEQKILKIE